MSGGAELPLSVHVNVDGDHLDRRLLARGDQLTVGRGRACDLRIAWSPEDDHVSRHMATLRVLTDGVLVRNASSSKMMVLRPLVGVERPIEPGEVTTSLPHRQFALVVTGRFGREYAIQVDARGLPSSMHGPVVEVSSDTAPTMVTPPVSFTPAQRRLLIALCEPLLTGSGPRAVAATYRQVAVRVGRQPGYVRNVFKQVRERLDSHGVPNLVSRNEDTHEDFRQPLAMWAIRSGTITVEDVAGDWIGPIGEDDTVTDLAAEPGPTGDDEPVEQFPGGAGFEGGEEGP